MDVIPWYSVVSGGQDRADLTANLSNGSEDRNDIRSPGYIDIRTLVVEVEEITRAIHNKGFKMNHYLSNQPV